MEIMSPEYYPAFPEMFMIFMGCVAIIADLCFANRFRSISYYIVLLALIGAAALTFMPVTEESQVVIFNGLFMSDMTTTILKSFVYLCVFVTLVYSFHYIDERDIAISEYNILALFSTVGMMVMISANSLITLYLGLELLSLPMYTMVAIRRSSAQNTEAAAKYFVMGALASSLLLYGMSMVYGATGTLTMPHIADAISSLPKDKEIILIVGLVFMISGIAFKLSAAPFHMWAPDVYTGAPMSVTLFISCAPKLAAFAMILHVLTNAVPSMQAQWQQVLIVMSILSMIIGNLFALAQHNIKRMLAYSAIAHIGYMLLGLIAGTPEGYASALFYMVAYSLMSLSSFGMLLVLAKDGYEPEMITDLSGLNSRNPWLAFLMLIIMFSLAGIPPTIGFLAKLWVLKTIIAVNLTWLAAVAIACVIIGLFFYLRIVKIMYFDAPADTQPLLYATDLRSIISLNGLALLLLGIFPLGLFRICQLAFT